MVSPETSKQISILLAEDNPADVELTREAFAATGIEHIIHVVEDGEEALAFLRRQGKYAKETAPNLIVIDLKEDAKLKSIPVIILTSSQADKDINEAYRLHSNCYVIKPMQFNSFMSQISTTARYWMETAKLPPPQN